VRWPRRTHRARLFTRAEYLDAARAAGLGPEWDPDGISGRGLVVAGHPARVSGGS
jgi:hypothetical protein